MTRICVEISDEESLNSVIKVQKGDEIENMKMECCNDKSLSWCNLSLT